MKSFTASDYKRIWKERISENNKKHILERKEHEEILRQRVIKNALTILNKNTEQQGLQTILDKDASIIYY